MDGDAVLQFTSSSFKAKTNGRGGERGIPLLRSCERCRRRKQRCDGEQPACGRCSGQRAECKYRQSGRFRTRHNKSSNSNSNSHSHMLLLSSSAAAVVDTGMLSAATTLSGLSATTTAPSAAAAAIMFHVPELSPASASLAPSSAASSALLMTSSSLADSLNSPALIDPVEILKTRDLPDLTQGLPDGILQQMWALVGGQAVVPAELAPNLALLDYESSNNDHNVPLALRSLARRHALQASAARLLAMLRASFVDSGMKIRTRQFWATLEAGTIGDFALLAHLVIATREASLAHAAAAAPAEASAAEASPEAACYAAARREWGAHGAGVAPTTGAVFALLLLSEYGYQTGRAAVMREFADHALATARRIVLRGAAYPWHELGGSGGSGGSSDECDVEREHVLACFWSAWVRAFTAAQVLGCAAPLPAPGASAYPAFPTHDMCHYTAQPVAVASPPGAVAFPSSANRACRRSRDSSAHCHDGAYSAATWQCALLGAEMHNRAVAVAAGQSPRAAYFAALRAWHRRLRLWRAAWPREWMRQMARVARLAQRVPHAEPLALDGEWLTDLTSSNEKEEKEDDDDEMPPLPPTPDTRPVGAHLFHESRMSAADAWLAVVFVMYDLTRLRAFRVALSLMQPSSSNGGDPLAAAIADHASRAEALDAARGLQNTLAVVQRLGFPPERLGIWVVFVLEQAIDVHCARLFDQTPADPAIQADALRRLAALVSHLLALKHWTAALYVFAALVKRYVEPTWLLSAQAANRLPPPLLSSSTSPWPATHVLTLLMRALRMDPRQFCAYTMPVVYAAVISTPVMPQSMRMRIASLLI